MGEFILTEASMETTALPVLKPLRLGELLDQAVRLYRRNFLAFVGIIAVVYIPYALASLLISVLTIYNLGNLRADRAYAFTPGYWLTILASMVLPFIYVVFVSGLGTAVFTYAVSNNYLGQKIGITEAYRQLGGTWLKLLLTLLVFGLLVIAAFIWIIVPCVGWLTGSGLFIFLAWVVGPLIPPVVVLEKLDVTKSIARAWDLARRRFWWLLGFAVVFYLFNMLVVTGPTTLISYLAGLVIGSSGNLATGSVLPTIISSVAGALLHLLVLPIQLIAWTLVYFDLRVRTEGFDLALLTMDPTGNMAADISNLPSAAPARQWLTGDDIGKFIVVTLVGIGIFALFIGLFALLGLGLGSFGAG
jgi:hypothetical protein